MDYRLICLPSYHKMWQPTVRRVRRGQRYLGYYRHKAVNILCAMQDQCLTDVSEDYDNQ